MPRSPLTPKSVSMPGELGDPVHQRCGLMGVELVTDDVPASGLRIGGDDGLQMGQEIHLGAGGSTSRGHDLAGDDIPAHKKAAGAMAHVLAFTPLHFARS